MKTRKTILVVLILLCLSVLASAQSVFITQIDTAQLLVGQKNQLYAHLLDTQGKPIEQPDLSKMAVYESSDGVNFVPATDLKLTVGSSKAQGISFFFLMDNSGSMYDTMEGSPTTDPNQTRYRAATKAASDFLLSVSGPSDTVGLGVFNTRYELLVAPVADKQKVAAALDSIVRPAREEGYTELYAAIRQASIESRSIKGRRALIVLSDGANYHFSDYENASNPQFGATRYRASEALDEAVREGWTVFAVNFGPDAKDTELAGIAHRSGGEVFDARNEAELSAIYHIIRDKILQEVLIEYRATMLTGDKRWVKLENTNQSGTASSTRYYYVGTVFGGETGSVPWWIFLLLPIALLMWLILSLIKFDKPSRSANLSLLYAPGVGKGTRIFAIGDKTIIGGDDKADITIAGNDQLQKSPVTIMRDTITGKYTLLSGATVTVNNRLTTRKDLEAGDVINFNGTIVVFDDQAADSPPSPKPKRSRKKT